MPKTDHVDLLMPSLPMSRRTPQSALRKLTCTSVCITVIFAPSCGR